MFNIAPTPKEPFDPGTRFSLHYIGHEAVLLDAASQRLYALNASAAFIWTCVEQGMRPQEIVERLCGTFGFAPTAAQHHVRDVMAAWYDLSLVAHRPQRQAVPRPELGVVAGTAAEKRADAAPGLERAYRLLDTVFRLRLPTQELTDEVARLFALVAEPGPVGDAVAIDVVANDEGFVLMGAGAVLDRCRRAEQVVSMVRAGLVDQALRRSGDLFALHAAAVGREGRCLLLPGESGSGKSTLAAALVAEGFTLLGDDTVVMASDLNAVRPMPLPICLKAGSWPLLALRYPEIDILPANARNDGKQVRYILPPTRQAAAPHPVAWVAFPRRSETPVAVELAVLNKANGLVRLMEGIAPLGEGLDATKVARLVRWIDEVAFFELRYSVLDEAIAQLADLCA